MRFTPDSPASAWTGVRIARPSRDLAASVAFYRDLLGLPLVGHFENHDGYDGVFFSLPGGAELELTAGQESPAGTTDEDLLVLYLPTPEDVDGIAGQLAGHGVRAIRSANPYWNRVGRTYLDPDGYRVVIAGPREGPPAAAPPLSKEQ